MQYMKLSSGERAAFMRSLSEMSAYLHGRFDALTDEAARLPGPNGAFSPVEQAWHLADLEREGFGLRIRRLLDEDHPQLTDFDGARIARERNYRSLQLRDALEAFDSARRANIAALESLTTAAWVRAGVQESVGPVSLCDMPTFMAQHDEAHRHEIEQWRQDTTQGRGTETMT
jgi:DinB superfamily